MTSGILTKKEKKVQPSNVENNLSTERDMPHFKGGTERDILQLVMRDALCAHAIVKGLRGKDRPDIEKVLCKLPWSLDDYTKEGTQRDILQLVTKNLPEVTLGPETLMAIDHLLGNQSPILDELRRLAERKFDWRTLPAPVEP